MRMRIQSAILWTVALALELVAINVCTAQSKDELSAHYAKWGAETLGAIQRDLWMPDLSLYAERAGEVEERRRRRRRPGANPAPAPSDRPQVESRNADPAQLALQPQRIDLEPAYLWGAGVQLSALAAAAKVDPAANKVPLTSYADVLETYWDEHNGIGGYSVRPNLAEADRFYDDNAWIVLGLVQAADITGGKKFLDRAVAAQKFVISGEDDQFGGGIYWRENPRQSKNTCSNGPAIVGALLLHQRTGDAKQLEDAERLYKWTQANLQDPEDGLYWDNIGRRGRVDRRKYSYNTALMIRANCLLYEIKGDSKYLAEAQRVARAAEAHWIVSETGAVKDGGKFAHMLLEALLAVGRLDKDPHWTEVARKSVDYVHANIRDPNGRYPNRWDQPPRAPLRSYMLLDQASAARAYFELADALHESPSAAGPAK